MNQALKNRVAWIVVSSADPNEVSLVLKAALVAVIPTIMTFSGLVHTNLGDGSLLTALVDGIAQFTQSALMLVASAMAIYGTARKIFFLVFPKGAVSTISQS
jgi:hypothetical protein